MKKQYIDRVYFNYEYRGDIELAFYDGPVSKNSSTRTALFVRDLETLKALRDQINEIITDIEIIVSSVPVSTRARTND